MKSTPFFRSLRVCLVAFLLAGADLNAGEIDKTLPKPADVQTLTVQPAKLPLKGADGCQLLVTAELAGNRLHDLTGHAVYEAADPTVVRVSSNGRVTPLKNGQTAVTIRFGNKSASVPITITSFSDNPPINFANEIVPIFSKLGCNAGGCHGKLSGQNGFRLSLFGFDANLDYETVVLESRGRRLHRSAPAHSLLLLKAAGLMAHGGGKRMEVGSDEYNLIRRWIVSGVPVGNPDDPVVTRIAVQPEERILSRQSSQQLAVQAHYSDGSSKDITRLALYESNEPDLAVVDAVGIVRTLEMSGSAAIMVRFQGQLAVFRAIVPLGQPAPNYPFEPRNLVDRLTHKKWQQLGLVPSANSSDEEFVRRVYVDIVGTLPTPHEVKRFLEDKVPARRDKLVDDLLERPEYSHYFANHWASVLGVKVLNVEKRVDQRLVPSMFAFHSWIRDAIAADKPYEEFVRDIVCATGDETRHPPVLWYLRSPGDGRGQKKPQDFVDETAQLFLGLRLQCAQCHHHPYERWSQDDYWGVAAFFGQIGRKTVTVRGFGSDNRRDAVYCLTPGSVMPGRPMPQGSILGVVNKRTGKPAVMKYLDDSASIQLGPEDDPRHKLMDWLTAPNNPYFARAIVNRYWAHFLGRGIVEPIDDMRMSNPPSNPELLDALARDLVAHKYSLKHLIRTICQSRTYQLSSVPNEFNKQDKQNFARYYARRMAAEVLFDAVDQVTNSPTIFAGLPQDRVAPRRAIMLSNESYPSYFLEVFGRPLRTSSCTCERSNETTLAQALHLLNSAEVQNKLSRPGGRADLLAKDSRADAEKIDELFLWVFARPATTEQRAEALRLIQRSPDAKTAYEDLLWAAINTKEFIFNR